MAPRSKGTGEVDAADVTRTDSASGTRDPSPIIFLLGPHGAGKSTLGSRACKELGIRFLDLAATHSATSTDGETSPGTGETSPGTGETSPGTGEIALGTGATPPGNGETLSDLDRLRRLIAHHAADVIELPWSLQRERKALTLARRSGTLLLIWAHPEDMQARSGREERLFTPVPRLKIRGGFGRNGTSCSEFRQLDRASDERLVLVDVPFEEAAEAVRDYIDAIREESSTSPAEREGLDRWVDNWRQDHSASPQVSKVIVEAMARYLAHLRSGGTSPRILSGIRSDLNAAGHLVLMYDAPKGTKILEHFWGPPWTYEFERKFTDSPALVARYHRSLEGFARFLKEQGDLPKDEEQAEGRGAGRSTRSR